ncbi:C-C motif chemokine 8-like [Chelmon rostratus]|uniref:C-C motif chemokine 8-like n=1 Tax=Chelmon rostratus TaxID=109905 RepID=UPI001BEB2F0E|nr:C-C motif chemokine 8-like [Chelmon rostratus]
MRLGLVLAALLCFTWMSGVHATHGPVINCLCPRLSTTKVRVQLIVNYTHQTEGICPIAAIIFHTKGGKKLCSDPNSGWARRAKLKVDEERKQQTTTTLQEIVQNDDGSASNITPAASTASKNTPRKRRRYGRRRQRKKSRRGRKGQRKHG